MLADANLRSGSIFGFAVKIISGYADAHISSLGYLWFQGS